MNIRHKDILFFMKEEMMAVNEQPRPTLREVVEKSQVVAEDACRISSYILQFVTGRQADQVPEVKSTSFSDAAMRTLDMLTETHGILDCLAQELGVQ